MWYHYTLFMVIWNVVKWLGLSRNETALVDNIVSSVYNTSIST
jgi:hypothetical protein